jgi:hypothetical protein
MASPPSFSVSETLWFCHMCNDGPLNYSIIPRCTNMLSNGHLCQHKICTQCKTFKTEVQRAYPTRSSIGPEKRPANPVDSPVARTGPDGSQDARGRLSQVPTIATSVPQSNSNTRELTPRESSASDSEFSSDEGAQVTPLSDTSYEDGTNAPWQADLDVVSAVARRVVDDWASQYQTTCIGDASDVRAHTGGPRGSEAPNLCSQRKSAGSHDATGMLKRGKIPGDDDDDDNNNRNDQSRKRRRQDADPIPNKDAPNLRLLACPYHKYDPQRYSELNIGEKEYRGCSSCYLIDINRLK